MAAEYLPAMPLLISESPPDCSHTDSPKNNLKRLNKAP